METVEKVTEETEVTETNEVSGTESAETETVEGDETGTATIEKTGTDKETVELEESDPKGYTKKINRIVYQREEQRRRAEAAEAEIERLKKTPEPVKKEEEKPSGEPVAPDADSFDDYDAYLKAHAKYVSELSKYTTKQLMAEERGRWESEQQEKEKRRREQEANKPYEEKLNRGRAKYDDFDTVAVENAIYSPVTKQLTLESDYTDEIAYYLGKNPGYADSLADMSMLEPSKEFIKLEEKIKKGELKPVKKSSSAPAPINPVTTVSKSSEDEDIDPNLPMDEYARRVQEQKLKKRK